MNSFCGVLALMASFVLAITSFTLQILGVCLESWLRTDVFYGAYIVNLGVWYYTRCVGDKCDTDSTADFKTPKESRGEVLGVRIEEIQGLTTTAIICTGITCVLILIVLCVARAKLYVNKCMRIGIVIGAFFALVAGVLSLIAAGRFARQLHKNSDKAAELGIDDIFKFPTALLLTGLGGIFICIVFFMLLIYFCCVLVDSDKPEKQRIINHNVTPHHNAGFEIQNGDYITSVYPISPDSDDVKRLDFQPIAAPVVHRHIHDVPYYSWEPVRVSNRNQSTVHYVVQQQPLKATEFVRISYHSKPEDFAL